MEHQSERNLRVGIFLAISLVLGAVAVIMLGGTSGLFEDRYKLRCDFDDVAGLREGAVVRLAGIDVGEVTAIRFSEDPDNKKIFVQLSLLTAYSDRLREDSVGRIETEGMLGDKYISVSVGSVDEPVLEHDAWLMTESSISLIEYQERAVDVLNDVGQIASKVKDILGTESEAEGASVARLIQSLENVLVTAEQGDGMLHALIYDYSLSNQLQEVARNARIVSQDMVAATGAIRNGSGFANALLFEEEGTEIFSQVAALASVLEGVVEDLQTEGSLLYALLYDPEREEIVDDFEAAAADIRALLEGFEQGEGTIGMLAQDESLYEELRSLVGGAQRSKLLRGYIRRTIEDGQERDAASWSEPEEEE